MPMRFAFFGTAPLAIEVLDALSSTGFLPSLIVAAPDTNEPRKKTIQFPPEKIWARHTVLRSFNRKRST